MKPDPFFDKFTRRGFAAGLVTTLLLRGKADAQAEGGSLLFVNAVGGSGRAFFELDGEDINPSGFDAGRATGWFEYAAKDYTVAADHDPFGAVSQKVSVAAGSRQALILHTVKVPSTKKGRPPVLSVAWHVMGCTKPDTNGGKTISLMSLCAKQVTLSIGGIPVKLQPGKQVQKGIPRGESFFALQMDVPVKETASEQVQPEVLATLNMEDRQHVAAVLFDDERRPGVPGLATFDLD